MSAISTLILDFIFSKTAANFLEISKKKHVFTAFNRNIIKNTQFVAIFFHLQTFGWVYLSDFVYPE